VRAKKKSKRKRPERARKPHPESGVKSAQDTFAQFLRKADPEAQPA